MIAAIIVASGTSSRMGFNKLSADLAGTSVLQRTVDQFLKVSRIEKLVVVCSNALFRELNLDGHHHAIINVPGGEDRQQSVMKGISALPQNVSFVAIHDGARPLISTEQIEKTIDATMDHLAVASARRITETVKRASTEHFITEHVCREDLWIIETPQVFEINLILQAYDKVSNDGVSVTDETSALEFIGVKTFLVNNVTPNPKITYPEDLILAEKLLRHD